ncbi:MAG TPA: histidine phosphatase family protein [Planctomycetota bacterium]|nr:histidine phosphatase family protein [Planctomycetota bacterium]
MQDSARLVLIRHGESVLGRARRYAGHRDTPLTSEGCDQISRLRSRFRKLRPEILVSSDLKRCRQTASLLAPGVRFVTTDRLRELDFGDWDGLTAASCRRRDPGLFDRWMRDPWSRRPPGGEKLAQLWTRVRAAVTELVRDHADRTLAIITHAGPIRALLASDPAQFWTASVPPGALFTLRWKAPPGRKGR